MITGSASFSVKPLHTLHNENSLFLCFCDLCILLSQDSEKLRLPTWHEVKSLLPPAYVPFQLANSADTVLFCPNPFEPIKIEEGNGLQYHPISVFHHMDVQNASLLASAYHLWSWYTLHRHCGRCGQPLSPDGEERALRCANCGLLIFPTISPAIIVAITDGDKILLAKNVRSELNHYALIAGYVEVGETLEHAVYREALEEVGLPLHSLRYLGNQPWGISGSQMFGFHAHADSSQPILLQQSELSDAKWFDRQALEPHSDGLSIAFTLIERFRTGRL
ncbi:MAG: NAD(+) diphosphatase [Clostridia bacterium]